MQSDGRSSAKDGSAGPSNSQQGHGEAGDAGFPGNTVTSERAGTLAGSSGDQVRFIHPLRGTWADSFVSSRGTVASYRRQDSFLIHKDIRLVPIHIRIPHFPSNLSSRLNPHHRCPSINTISQSTYTGNTPRNLHRILKVHVSRMHRTSIAFRMAARINHRPIGTYRPHRHPSVDNLIITNFHNSNPTATQSVL